MTNFTQNTNFSDQSEKLNFVDTKNITKSPEKSLI